MGTLLKEYRSQSSSRVYEILEPDSGGDPYCTCPGWKFSKDSPRSCKHLVEYHREMQTPQQVNKGVSMPVDVDEPIDTEDVFEKSITECMG